MSKETITLGKKGDLVSIVDLFEACKLDLLNMEIFQWDDQYPNKEYLQWVLQEEEMFVYFKGTKVMGAMVLNEWQLPEWEDVQWSETEGEGFNPSLLLCSTFGSREWLWRKIAGVC